MPGSNNPDGVSSMFSLVLTGCAPAARMAMTMEMSSARLRQPADLLDDDVVDVASSRPSQHGLSAGRLAVLADSPRSRCSCSTSARDSLPGGGKPRAASVSL